MFSNVSTLNTFLVFYFRFQHNMTRQWQRCLLLLAEMWQKSAPDIVAYGAAAACWISHPTHRVSWCFETYLLFSKLFEMICKPKPCFLCWISHDTLAVWLRKKIVLFQVSACEKCGEWPAALQLLQDLQLKSLQLDQVAGNACLSALGRSEKWRIALALYLAII